MDDKEFEFRLKKLRTSIENSKRLMEQGFDTLKLSSDMIDEMREIVIRNLKAENPQFTDEDIDNYFRKQAEFEIKLRKRVYN